MNVLAGHGDDLHRHGGHPLVRAEHQRIPRDAIIRAVLLDDLQHIAQQEKTAMRRDRIPRSLVEETATVGKREMETARAMAFLVTFAQITDAGDRFAQGISGF